MAARLARSANPTSMQLAGRFFALSNRQPLTAIRLGQHAVLSLPRYRGGIRGWGFAVYHESGP